MKLNNQKIYITGEQFDLGKSLYEVDILNIYDHKQSTIYYSSGLPEIDTLFGQRGYVNQGYVSTMVSSENGISIFFLKYLRDQVEEIAIVHIKRDNILHFEEIKKDSLTVVKREEAKHKAKYILKNGTGLIGSVTGFTGEKLGVSANTHEVPGTVYKLFFLDKNDIRKCIEMYSSREFEPSSQLFLNTYYKKELPDQAKIPVKESSSCFIATACYKDLFAPELITFRNYRDTVLRKSILGVLFIKFYYKFSPFVYKRLYTSPKINTVIKKVLDKLHNSIEKRL